MENKWIKFKDEYPKDNAQIIVRYNKNIYKKRTWKQDIYIASVKGKQMRWMYYTDYCKLMESLKR